MVDWDILVEHVRWGKIKEIVTKSNVRPDETSRFNYICEYKLKQPD